MAKPLSCRVPTIEAVPETADETVVNLMQGGPRLNSGAVQAFRFPGYPIVDSVTPLMMAAGVFRLLELLLFVKLTLSMSRPNKLFTSKSTRNGTCCNCWPVKVMFLNLTLLPVVFSAIG